MLRIVDRPDLPTSWDSLDLWVRRAKRGELIEPAKQVADFAREHPFEWVQTDLFPPHYAGRILAGVSKQFYPEGRWVASTRGGLFHVKYIGILGELCFNGTAK